MKSIVLILLIWGSAISATAYMPDSSRKANSKSVEVNYNNIIFSEGIPSWHNASMQWQSKGSTSTVIARLNIASRYNKLGWQIEAEIYKKVKKNFLMHTSYGYSPSALFPVHRCGLELYKNIPRVVEISVAAKTLIFQQSTAVFYAASVAKYSGNKWLSYRIFIVPAHSALTLSHVLNARHYTRNEPNYYGASVSIAGSQPEVNIAGGTGAIINPAFFLRSQKVGMSAQRLLKGNYLIKPSIEVARQELSIAPNHFQPLYLISFSVQKKYR